MSGSIRSCDQSTAIIRTITKASRNAYSTRLTVWAQVTYCTRLTPLSGEPITALGSASRAIMEDAKTPLTQAYQQTSSYRNGLQIPSDTPELLPVVLHSAFCEGYFAALQHLKKASGRMR